MEFGNLDRTMMRGKWASIKTTRLYINSAVASEVEISAAPTQQWAIDRLANEAKLPLLDGAKFSMNALPRCGSSRGSVDCTVSPDGSRNWMAAEELEPLSGGLSSQPEVESCSVRRRSGFPSFLRPLVLSWLICDASDRQPLNAATTRIWCCTPNEMLS